MSPATNKTELIVGSCCAALFALLGIGILIGAWALHRSKTEFARTAATAEGTVVDFATLDTGMMSGERTSQRVPVIRFTPADGEEVTLTVEAYAAWAEHERGDTVTVLYAPNDPAHAEIQTFYQQWAFQLIMAVIGICFVLVPPYTLWRHAKKS